MIIYYKTHHVQIYIYCSISLYIRLSNIAYWYYCIFFPYTVPICIYWIFNNPCMFSIKVNTVWYINKIRTIPSRGTLGVQYMKMLRTSLNNIPPGITAVIYNGSFSGSFIKIAWHGVNRTNSPSVQINI